MMLQTKIDRLKWDLITHELHQKGFTVIKKILTVNQCKSLIQLFEKDKLYRKTVIMERHRFGLGAYKYFNYPLPALVQSMREAIYPHLAPIANLWMKALNLNLRYPLQISKLLSVCKSNHQTHPTPLILKYGKGGFNTLHQDLYGLVYFPMQLAIFLTEPGKDYEGGEFIITEQVPRTQSKAMVITPRMGDIVLFTTNFRPVKGARGYYRAHMRHGVSPVKRGNRYTLGIIFHDALN